MVKPSVAKELPSREAGQSHDAQEHQKSEMNDAELEHVSAGAYEFYVQTEGVKQGKAKEGVK
ncbi:MULTISPECIES: hypothetical protein [unclassified Methylobacterium]|uniref:hypothetical protein n=1 Tax=unclassified Methylobacterium TaxID=2615210 RepID=UPI00035D6E02|nr:MULTISPECIES: hypothetical protein [Methylobacterium]WFT81293.1 hypothetical protein QA634_05200 [Methylobacterium nodulans]